MQLDEIRDTKNQLLSELSAVDLLALAKELDQFDLAYRNLLTFPRYVRFGIELEYEQFDRTKVGQFIKNSRIMWSSVEDESLSSGGEVVSPRLTDNRKTWENLKAICEFLRINKVDTCHSAGLHIHVGAHILGDNMNAWRRFAKLCTIYERILIRFGYGDKVNARSSLLGYARPVGYKFLNSIDRLLNNKDFFSIREFYYQIYDDKKNALNLRSLEFLSGIVPFNTIEFRNFNSTVDEAIIQNDINAACRMVLAAANKDFDEDFLDFKIKKLKDCHLSKEQYLEQCNQVLLREMAEFVDLIFHSTEDKLYFMKQYIKGFETKTNHDACEYARVLAK